MSDKDYEKLQRWVQRKISDIGEQALASAIEQAMNDGLLNEIKRDYKTAIGERLDLLEEYLMDAYNEKSEREFDEYQNNLDVDENLPFQFDEDEEYERLFR